MRFKKFELNTMNSVKLPSNRTILKCFDISLQVKKLTMRIYFGVRTYHATYEQVTQGAL